MIIPPHFARPHGLPLRLVLGGAAMAVVYLLLHGGSPMDATKLLLGLSISDNTSPLTLAACFRSLALVASALLLAFSTSLSLLYLTLWLQPSALRYLSQISLLLFAAPIPGLVWAWAGWWIGSRAGVIETLMPPRPIGIGEDPSEFLARQAWTWLAPIIALAIPITGTLFSQLAQTLPLAKEQPLTLGLRARGFAASRMLDRHLLPMLKWRWHQVIEASLPSAFLLTGFVEYALDFPGWGSGLVHAIQNQNAQAAAFGLYSSGLMLALSTSLLYLVRPRSPHCPTPVSSGKPSRLPFVFTGFLLLLSAPFLLIDSSSPLHYQAIQLSTGQTWLSAGENDVRASVWILELAFVGGIVLAALRLTILGNWLRRYGSLETLIWSPLPIWALIWCHTSSHIISIDLAIAALAAVAFSIHLHYRTNHYAGSPLLDASRSLGATRWQAWRAHALLPWLLDLAAFLFSLIGTIWWLRIANYGLLPVEKSDPQASIGSFLAHANTDAFHRPLPLLAATLVAAVSILSLWTVARIIHPQHPDDS
jgi:ABC-type dipeptide/oligopeptide/nickel transport system permease component